MPTDSSQDIRDRTFEFGCRVARLALRLAPQPGVRCIVDQLLKSGTSVGANLEEAKAGSSKRDFVKYVEISLREARETVYWLRICAALQLGPAEDLRTLRSEGDEIARILGSIVVNTRRRMLAGYAVFVLTVLSAFLNFEF
ncbi:MAG TPA: four helix bundle protein [Vicinamibacterales bacterium]|nr:four helix bundle protein [Vicinamibacterales bacterium]